MGAAAFLGLYLMIMAFVLALNNRGFSEIGVNGLRAQDMAGASHQDAIQAFDESLARVEGAINAVEHSTGKRIHHLAARVEALETGE